MTEDEYESILPYEVLDNHNLTDTEKIFFARLSRDLYGQGKSSDQYEARTLGTLLHAPQIVWIGALENLKKNGHIRFISKLNDTYEIILTRVYMDPKEGTKPTRKKPKVQFNEFWDIVPKKVRKEDAKKKWSSMTKKDQKRAIEFLPAYVKNHEDAGKMEFLPAPVVYLRRKSWNDEALPYATAEGQAKKFTFDENGNLIFK